MKMIKAAGVLTAFVLLSVALMGCGSSSGGRHAENTTGVEAVLEQQMAAADGTGASDVSTDSSSDTSSDVQVVATPDNYDAGNQNAGDTGTSDMIPSNAPAPDEIGADAEELLSSTEGVDVDLSLLTGDMVYAEVYNIMVAPEDYIGKTIRMQGTYLPYYDETKDKYYFSCIIKDAMACCAQGIEFELTDDYTFPDDYPNEDSEIMVTGTFDTYEEDGGMYCTLREATLGK
ncbi:MAG: hypothetical protein K6G12_08010 [Lachnospiraceae bacterium]|nr:hypothetical protein [Lachnospiraceae bacterium]